MGFVPPRLLPSPLAAQRPLLGVKRTWRGLVSMSANDPKRTFGRGSRCALEQPQESANHRHHRQDENGLQDTHHHGVVVVHPICRGLPHFALPLLLVSTNQPPQGEAARVHCIAFSFSNTKKPIGCQQLARLTYRLLADAKSWLNPRHDSAGTSHSLTIATIRAWARGRG